MIGNNIEFILSVTIGIILADLIRGILAELFTFLCYKFGIKTEWDDECEEEDYKDEDE